MVNTHIFTVSCDKNSGNIVDSFEDEDDIPQVCVNSWPDSK